MFCFWFKECFIVSIELLQEYFIVSIEVMSPLLLDVPASKNNYIDSVPLIR